jgi:Arc/MetJ-type ribon-helix-helix transcriptional regulator
MVKKLHLIQIKLPSDMVEEIDKMIGRGFYVNRSEVIRDALRRLVLEKEK